MDQQSHIEVIKENQYIPGRQEERFDSHRVVIKFTQLLMGRSTFEEMDDSSALLYRNMVRLRNLTYAAPLYCEI